MFIYLSLLKYQKVKDSIFSRNWPPLFPTTDTVSLTLGHGLKLCSLLAVVQIVELACLQLVLLLLLPLVFGL